MMSHTVTCGTAGNGASNCQCALACGNLHLLTLTAADNNSAASRTQEDDARGTLKTPTTSQVDTSRVSHLCL